MMYPRLVSTPILQKQRGIATVLIVVLVGLALTATSIGIMHSVRSTQQKQVAMHAVTHSQAGAWVAVEIFRRYLAGLTQTQVDALILNQSISFQIPTTSSSSSSSTSSSGAMTGPYINVVITDRTAPAGTGPSDAYKLKTKVSYYDTAAKSTSKIEVVYQFFPNLCADCLQTSAVLDFYRDVTMSGDIAVRNDGNVNRGNFNVDGNIDLSNISMSGLNKLQSTGNVTIGSAVSAQEIYANGTVTLQGSANVNKVSALLGITLAAGSSAAANLLYSNGPVVLAASSTNYVTTQGDITYSGWGTQGQLTSGANVLVTSTGSGNITQISSEGTTRINSTATVTTILSKGSVTCPNSGWNNFTSITTKATAISCKNDPAKIIQNQSVTLSPITALTPFTMQRPVIDVWTLKNSANYVFEYESGKYKVTVKNINSITDGIYYLGTHGVVSGRSTADFLCDSVSAARVCTAPTTPFKTICQGASNANACFSYDEATSKWTISGKNLAPGIMWFKGNLKIANGIYYNTFMASGNIESEGSSKIYASNYAGYSITCSVIYPTDPTTDFAGLYPTKLCNIGGSRMKMVAAGNAALIAGGKNPDAGGAYQGGDINLSALGGSSEIFGSVVAGDFLRAGNSTTVHGSVTAVALTNEVSTNTLGNSTVIDLRNLPNTYQADQLPNMTGVSTGNVEVAKVLWSRYM